MTSRELSQHTIDKRQALDDRDEWVVEQLARCRVAFQEGDKRSLAVAIQICGGMGLPLPLWAVRPFNEHLGAMIRCEKSSWDDLLGGNPRTTTKLTKAQLNYAARVKMIAHLETTPPARIDDEWFVELGEQLRVSGAKAKRLYYSLHPSIHIPAKKRSPQKKK